MRGQIRRHDLEIDLRSDEMARGGVLAVAVHDIEPATFNLPVERLRQSGTGDGSALRLRDILLGTQPDTRATVQITSERACVLGGTDESVALLKLCAGDWNALVVHSLYDGDHAEPGDTVMTLEGPYAETIAPLAGSERTTMSFTSPRSSSSILRLVSHLMKTKKLQSASENDY